MEPIYTLLAAMLERGGVVRGGVSILGSICPAVSYLLGVGIVEVFEGDFCADPAISSLKVMSGLLHTCKNGKGQSNPNLWQAAKNSLPLISKLFLALVMLYK